jgi:hypothetical protein
MKSVLTDLFHSNNLRNIITRRVKFGIVLGHEMHLHISGKFCCILKITKSQLLK